MFLFDVTLLAEATIGLMYNFGEIKVFLYK